MVFGMPGHDDEEARRKLLRQGEDRLAGPAGAPPGSGQIGSGQIGWPGQPAPYGSPPTPIHRQAGTPGYSATTGYPAAPRQIRKGQPVSWLALVLGLGGALMLGIGISAALAAIVFTDHPFAQASDWGSLATFGLVVCFVALLAAVVALFVARPKLLATLALLVALVAPWIAAIIGVKAGVDVFGQHANEALGDAAQDLGNVFTALLIAAGVDPTPYQPLIAILFGG